METTPLLKPMSKAPLLKPNTRILSIDALRSFDMLFISGAGTFLVLLEMGSRYIAFLLCRLVSYSGSRIWSRRSYTIIVKTVTLCSSAS